MTVINESFEDIEEWPWPRAIVYDSGPISIGEHPVPDDLRARVARRVAHGPASYWCADVGLVPCRSICDCWNEAAALIAMVQAPPEAPYTHDHTGRLAIQTPGGVTHPDFEG